MTFKSLSPLIKEDCNLLDEASKPAWRQSQRPGPGLGGNQAWSEMSGGVRAARGVSSEVTKVEDGLMSVSLGQSLTPETRSTCQGRDNQRESVWRLADIRNNYPRDSDHDGASGKPFITALLSSYFLGRVVNFQFQDYRFSYQDYQQL